MSIYFDNASTTPIAPQVREAMMGALADEYYNPSSVYRDARMVKVAVEAARNMVAEAICAPPDTVIFTSGGTEADNAAIKGVAWSKGKGHIITSTAEHHAVLSTCEWLKTQGFTLTVLPVDDGSAVDPRVLEKAIRPDTILCSFMWVNNETGAVNPIEQLVKIAQENGILFHTDAVQALPIEEIDVSTVKVDLLSLSAHKIYGPMGSGALYCRSGLQLQPLLHGGQQENLRRGGTEGVPSIIGLGKAAQLLTMEKQARRDHVISLKQTLLQELSDVQELRINGSSNDSPAILNIGFKGVEAEALVLLLDHNGIQVSMGAACNSDSIEPSHVLKAMRVPTEYIHGSIRLSFGTYNTLDEAAEVAKTIKRIVARLRK